MNDEPLPTGWRQAVDRKTGRVFYGNELTQSTQWQRPSSKYTTRTRYANLQHSGGNKKATVRKNQIAILIAGAVLLYFGPSYFMDPDGVHSQEEDYMRRVQAHRQQQERQQQRGRGGLDVYNNVPGTVGNLKYTGVILPNKMVGAEFVYADLKSRSEHLRSQENWSQAQPHSFLSPLVFCLCVCCLFVSACVSVCFGVFFWCFGVFLACLWCVCGVFWWGLLLLTWSRQPTHTHCSDYF
eukprot:m.60878 g.60878  ORF g.60878 m.60878 type:complete len:239 (+) comp22899_c0_seq1:123-839(+)